MIKAVAPQDLISLSTTQDVPALKVVALLNFRELVAPANPMAVFDEKPVIPKNNSCSTPQAVPAPPAIA